MYLNPINRFFLPFINIIIAIQLKISMITIPAGLINLIKKWMIGM